MYSSTGGDEGGGGARRSLGGCTASTGVTVVSVVLTVTLPVELRFGQQLDCHIPGVLARDPGIAYTVEGNPRGPTGGNFGVSCQPRLPQLDSMCMLAWLLRKQRGGSMVSRRARIGDSVNTKSIDGGGGWLVLYKHGGVYCRGRIVALSGYVVVFRTISWYRSMWLYRFRNFRGKRG